MTGPTLDSTRFACKCEKPSEHPSPLRKGTCVKCCGELGAFWMSSDQTLNEWWDRLKMGMFFGEPSASFDRIRAVATQREHDGRKDYGLRYLGRANLEEAVEEVADFLNYLFFDSLNTIRREGHDPDIDLVLTAAAKACEAMEHLDHLRARRRGAP